MATREQITDEAYESFVRESAGLSVDMSSLPGVRARQPRKREDENFIDPRFAPLSTTQTPGLRRALAKFANENTGDREVVDVLTMGGVKDNSEGREGLVHFTVSETGEDVAIEITRTRDGWCGTVNGKRHAAATRDALLSGIVRSLNSDTRELTDVEKRRCAALCFAPNAGFLRAVGQYVAYKTGMALEDAMTDTAYLETKNAKAFDEATHFCWLTLRGDFSPSDEWRGFLSSYALGRSLNIAILDGARAAFEKRQEAAAREMLLSPTVEAGPEEAPPPPSYEELDALDDNSLSQHLRSVRRTQAKMVRSGVL
ncbi:MAG: hypothetical protein WB716_10850 [Candidatus Acidiferrales bacterium]